MSESAVFALIALLHVPGVVLLVALLLHLRRADPPDAGPPGPPRGRPWRWGRGGSGRRRAAPERAPRRAVRRAAR